MKSECRSRLDLIVEKSLREAVLYFSDGPIDFVNQSFLDYFRFPSRHLTESVRVESLFADTHLIPRLKEQLTISSCTRVDQVECIRLDQTRFWCSMSMCMLTDNEGVFFACSLSDITDIVNNEKLLKNKNEDLKKLNAQLDRFLYSASHDIRQPLTSMMGLIRLLQMEHPDMKQNEYVAKLNDSVTRLDEFLHQVMLFSQNSHSRIKAQRIELNDLILQRIDRLKAAYKMPIPEFTVECVLDTPFFSDIERVLVILDHVLRNCIEYQDVSKPKPFVKILVTANIESVFVEVIDNGIGISKMHLDKVTDMFYRGTDRSKGSGLGLYIVKETLLKLKGSITIDSEVNLGTIVVVEIPNDAKGVLMNRKRLMSRQHEDRRGLSLP